MDMFSPWRGTKKARVRQAPMPDAARPDEEVLREFLYGFDILRNVPPAMITSGTRANSAAVTHTSAR